MLSVFGKMFLLSMSVFSQHSEEKEDGMDVEEGEMGDEDEPAPW